MPRRSRYDELHDEFHAILTEKRGTRYERLAAAVFAAMESESIVVHDLRLIGEDTGVKHQIDVLVEQASRQRRVLIECKDFDVRGARVGLGVVRDFWGVVDDVHPDEAWIITCNGFTRDAMTFAKGRGIKLATLRMFESEDWENRVHTIVINTFESTVDIGHPNIRINMDDSDAVALAASAPNGFALEAVPHVFFDGIEELKLIDILRGLAGDTSAMSVEEVIFARPDTKGGWVTANGVQRFPMNGFSVSAPVQHRAKKTTLSAMRGAARLLLTNTDGLDVVVWQETLVGHCINDDGRVVLASATVQKRLMATVESIALPPTLLS
jgi:hypothetical protein